MGADWEQLNVLKGAELLPMSCYGTMLTWGFSISTGQGSLGFTLTQLCSSELRSTASNCKKPQVTAVNGTGVVVCSRVITYAGPVWVHRGCRGGDLRSLATRFIVARKHS